MFNTVRPINIATIRWGEPTQHTRVYPNETGPILWGGGLFVVQDFAGRAVWSYFSPINMPSAFVEEDYVLFVLIVFCVFIFADDRFSYTTV